MNTQGNTSLFLQAEWRKLLMANYVVAPEMVQPYLPQGTELDYWEDKCYVSLVGFMFLNTTILGWNIPFHRDFEEVNLRFYVRRKSGHTWRRGVVFIKEIVPKPAISMVANTIYGEKYVTRQMFHQWKPNEVVYGWKPFFSAPWNQMSAEHSATARPIAIGSEAEFITEHYWGYADKSHQRTMEYEVCHPRWDVYDVTKFELQGPLSREYGPAFAEVLQQRPNSVFLAEGSAIEINQGRVITMN